MGLYRLEGRRCIRAAGPLSSSDPVTAASELREHPGEPALGYAPGDPTQVQQGGR